jgi:hypothetical protein
MKVNRRRKKKRRKLATGFGVIIMVYTRIGLSAMTENLAMGRVVCRRREGEGDVRRKGEESGEKEDGGERKEGS